MSEPIILTLCSTIARDEKARPNQGHVWIKIERPSKPPESYGLFTSRSLPPSEERAVRRSNFVGYNTDVLRNMEIHPRLQSSYRERTTMRWAISPEKYEELMDEIRKPQKYDVKENNCTDWACGVISKIIGVSFSSRNDMLAEIDGYPVPVETAPADAKRIWVSTPRILPLALITPAFHGAAAYAGINPQHAPALTVRLLPSLPAVEGGGTPLRTLLSIPFLSGMALQSAQAASVLHA